jgi:hypothetical protein
MATYTYPTNATIDQIAQALVPQLTMSDLLFQLMPIRNKDASVVMWEQKDNYPGLQQLRGLNGEPPRVNPVGAKKYMMRPGVYGEYMDIEEEEITERRSYGQFSGAIDVSDLVLERQTQLLKRRIDRIKYIGWTLLQQGVFAIANPQSGITHTDAFPISTYAGSAWATAASGTPLADFRAVQLLGPPQGTNFDNTAIAVMNRTTANYLLANTNAADIGGKRTSGLANVLSMGDVQSLLTGEGLPNIVVYDGGYVNDAGTFTRWFADKKITIVGKREDGSPIAEYLMTRNAQNEGVAPGPYMKVENTMDQNKVPAVIKVHDGHNGGPAIYFPGSIVNMTVT